MVVNILGRRGSDDDDVLLMFAATSSLLLSKMMMLRGNGIMMMMLVLVIRIRTCRSSSRTNHPITVKHVMYYRWYDLVEYIRGGGNDFTAHLMQWCYNYFGEKRVNDDDKWW